MNVKKLISFSNESGFAQPITVPCQFKRHDVVKIIGLEKLETKHIAYSYRSFEACGGSVSRPRVWDIVPTSNGIIKEVKQNKFNKTISIDCVFGHYMMTLNPKNLEKVS